MKIVRDRVWQAGQRESWWVMSDECWVLSAVRGPWPTPLIWLQINKESRNKEGLFIYSLEKPESNSSRQSWSSTSTKLFVQHFNLFNIASLFRNGWAQPYYWLKHQETSPFLIHLTLHHLVVFFIFSLMIFSTYLALRLFLLIE